ncbi:DUF5685 family protein [Nocardia harenae]|uniref:DUF5685 family protein n=1 Tax=Nocardia harenae TaxID=358707 RepID=UPI00082D1471|nr:DUF5685 family protein [Nocardia harenae]
MFGVLTPCAHGAVRHGIAPGEWYAQLCGLCLGLRDEHGQLARTATNTDAMALTVLTEAQSPAVPARSGVGPCALRGMRKAEVAVSPGVRLASTASLLLGSAKLEDHVRDGDIRRGARRPVAAVSGRWARRAALQADSIGLDIGPMVMAIAEQSALESHSQLTLEDLLAPSAFCAGELTAHTAVLAGKPENAEALRATGRHFGALAHLADAVEDLDDDLAAGKFNPLAATGTTRVEAYRAMREAERGLHTAITDAGLDTTPTVRWVLLDPLEGLLHRLGHELGVLHARRRPRHNPVAVFPQAPAPKPGLLEGIGLLFQYPTGYACFASHRRPCSGERKNSWLSRMDCGDACECCDCSNCCCDCDCCDCNC